MVLAAMAGTGRMSGPGLEVVFAIAAAVAGSGLAFLIEVIAGSPDG